MSALAKPSYLICYIPALSAFIGWRLINRQTIPWQPLILAFAVPAIAILSWQYQFTYSDSAAARMPSRIIFAPFVVVGGPSFTLLIKILLSILFPLLVLATHVKQAIKNTALMFSWLTFAIAVFFAYMLAESGRISAGNFFWCTQATLFILYCTTAVFLLKQFSEEQSPLNTWKAKYMIIATIAAAHLISGLYFYTQYYLNGHNHGLFL